MPFFFFFGNSVYAFCPSCVCANYVIQKHFIINCLQHDKVNYTMYLLKFLKHTEIIHLKKI